MMSMSPGALDSATAETYFEQHYSHDDYYSQRIDSRFLLPGQCRLPHLNCYPSATGLKGGPSDGEA